MVPLNRVGTQPHMDPGLHRNSWMLSMQSPIKVLNFYDTIIYGEERWQKFCCLKILFDLCLRYTHSLKSIKQCTNIL